MLYLRDKILRRRSAAGKLSAILLGVLLAGQGLLHQCFHRCDCDDSRAILCSVRPRIARTMEFRTVPSDASVPTLKTECPFCSAAPVLYASEPEEDAVPPLPSETVRQWKRDFIPTAKTSPHLSRAPPPIVQSAAARTLKKRREGVY